MPGLRILCLHGYHGGAEILRRQMAPLVSAVRASSARASSTSTSSAKASARNDLEFVYVDAPSLTERDFGWWHSPSRGWDRTRAWAIDIFGSGPGFDGVFGFSQGAAFTGLLAGMRSTLAEDPALADDRAVNPIRFDFALMVGGFKNDAPQHAELYRHRFNLPSVHIIGRTDGIIPPNQSQDLADQFENPLILRHRGGHIVPDDRAVVEGVARFLDRMSSGPVLSPGPLPALSDSRLSDSRLPGAR
jgi:hypothetical protein